MVRIDIAGKPNGTGFFVGRGLVLTCNHVVREKAIADLSILWGDRRLSVLDLKIPNADVDLALLQLPDDLPEHDWVVLGGDIAEREKLKTFGYPDGYAQGDPATFEFEGMTGDHFFYSDIVATEESHRIQGLFSELSTIYSSLLSFHTSDIIRLVN